MAYTTLRVTTEEQAALITLARPERRNAISPEMIEELLAALAAIEAGPERVVIIRGEGVAFCAGMDLEVLKRQIGQSPEEILTGARRIATLFRRLWSFPKPLIAAVNGAAVAGGCGIATLCDFTLAAEEATFGYTEVRVGFMPALVSMFLERQVGEKVARDLLLTGRICDAEEALALGLASRVLPAGQLMPAARELAASLIALSPGSLTATKRLLRARQRGGNRPPHLDGHRREHCYSRHPGLSRGTFRVSRKAPAALDRPMSDLSKTPSDFSEITARVRYAETDQMGVVYYANYYIYFEIGRVEYMRQRGVAYKEMEQQDDSFIVVAESSCRYRRPARYDDVLRIRTRVMAVRRRTISFAYEILNDASGELLATGQTMHVICDRQGRPKALPEKYRKYFPAAEGEGGSLDEI